MNGYYTYRLFCHMALVSEGVGFMFIGGCVFLTPMYLNGEFRKPERFAAQVLENMHIESEFYMATRVMLESDMADEGVGDGDTLEGFEMAKLARRAGALEDEDVEAVSRSLTPAQWVIAQEHVA